VVIAKSKKYVREEGGGRDGGGREEDKTFVVASRPKSFLSFESISFFKIFYLRIPSHGFNLPSLFGKSPRGQKPSGGRPVLENFCAPQNFEITILCTGH
jgi:hypothetical protein